MLRYAGGKKRNVIGTRRAHTDQTKMERDSVMPDKSILVIAPAENRLSSIQFIPPGIALNTPHYIQIDG